MDGDGLLSVSRCDTQRAIRDGSPRRLKESTISCGNSTGSASRRLEPNKRQACWRSGAVCASTASGGAGFGHFAGLSRSLQGFITNQGHSQNLLRDASLIAEAMVMKDAESRWFVWSRCSTTMRNFGGPRKYSEQNGPLTPEECGDNDSARYFCGEDPRSADAARVHPQMVLQSPPRILDGSGYPEALTGNESAGGLHPSRSPMPTYISHHRPCTYKKARMLQSRSPSYRLRETRNLTEPLWNFSSGNHAERCLTRS